MSRDIGGRIDIDEVVANALGIHVTKSTNLADGGSPIPVFAVTGKVLIKLLVGEVTTVVATTTTAKFQRKTGTVDMSAATTITSDAVGTMYMYSGDAGAILSGTLAAGDAPVVGFAHLAGGPLTPVPFGLIGRVAEEIDLVLDQVGTGIIRWDLWYLPLEQGAKVLAA